MGSALKTMFMIRLNSISRWTSTFSDRKAEGTVLPCLFLGTALIVDIYLVSPSPRGSGHPGSTWRWSGSWEPPLVLTLSGLATSYSLVGASPSAVIRLDTGQA